MPTRSAFCAGRRPDDALIGPDEAAFDFADLKFRPALDAAPNAGRLPWWVLSPSRRCRAPAPRLPRAPRDPARRRRQGRGRGRTIGENMECSGPLYERLWHPVLLAALNTSPATAMSASPRASCGRRWARAARPASRWWPRRASPTPSWTRRSRPGQARARRCASAAACAGSTSRTGVVTALQFSDGPEAIGPGDSVVLALPPWVTADLLPEVPTPLEFSLDRERPFRGRSEAGSPLVLGVVNSLTEWLFAYSDRYSVTISGADRLLDVPREDLARQIWGRSPRSAILLRNCHAGKSSRRSVQRSPRRRPRRRGGLLRARGTRTSFSRAIGRPPACHRPSRVRSPPARRPPTR